MERELDDYISRMEVKPEPKQALFGEDNSLFDYANKLNIGMVDDRRDIAFVRFLFFPLFSF
jgi:hypothetical protein